MEISDDEINAANYELSRHVEGRGKIERVRAALAAAYTVRKASKQAKRERQRKEKDKQVVESVKPAGVAEFLKEGETVLDRLKRGQRDEVMVMKLLAREKRKTEGLPPMEAEQIKHMAERFLGWRLPEDFHPDGGITFKAMFNENTPHPMKASPIGTNLFSYEQAKAMVEYMLDGLPYSSKAPEWDGKFGVGEWEMRNGQKAIVAVVEVSFLRGAIDGVHITWTLAGTYNLTAPSAFDLIRPWSKAPLSIMPAEDEQ